MKFNFKNLFKSNEKTGLALGGGAVYGAAHIGVLRAIEEENIQIDYISGTSIGAFIAALYAFGTKVSDIDEMVRQLDWNNISSISLSQYALLSNDKFKKVLEDTLGSVNMEDAKIPLAVIAADIVNGEKVVIKSGNLGSAVQASTCIPGLFKPVKLGDRMLVDGGIVENVPVSPLLEFGANHIIAVDLNSADSNEVPKNILDVLLNTFHFTLKNATNLITEDAHLMIQPNLSSFNRYDVNQVESLIENGYQEAKKALQSSD